MNQNQSTNIETEEQLRERIAKCNRIINGLENHGEFNELMGDFRNEMKRLDDNWHLITDVDKLKTFQMTKLAYMAILGSLDNYKYDLKVATAKLIEMNNEDSVIAKDYDNDKVGDGS